MLAQYRTTPEVSRLLGRSVNSLHWLIWDGRIPTPARLGNTYAWTDKDIARAAEVLQRHGPGSGRRKEGVVLRPGRRAARARAQKTLAGG
jgi:predicted DNA-binding transcriptional regulator AlpA